jgi:hypothetical protein
MKTKPTKSESGLQSRPEQAGSKNSKPSVEQNPTPATAQAPAWTGVFFDGPEAEQDREGEEIPVWHVYVGTEDAEPVSRVYRVFSFAKAESLAQAMSKDRRLELVAEAQPA